MEKNRFEKVRKHVFYKHTNIVTKKCGGINARKNVSINTRISREKNMEKNLLEKVRKQVFYKHTNVCDHKIGKKRVKKFIPETPISRPKNDGKKSSGKSAK